MAFQMPLVATSMPQSQPKLQAILRSSLYGWWFACGRGPCSMDRAARSAPVRRIRRRWCSGRAAGAVDVETVAAVLVLGAADNHTVDLDGGDGVEAVRPPDRAGRRRRRPSRSRLSISPGGVADPLLIGLVGPVERVGDQAGGEQVGVHASGHGRRDGLFGYVRRHRTGYCPDGPSGVQRREGHVLRSSRSGREEAGIDARRGRVEESLRYPGWIARLRPHGACRRR